MTRYKVTAEGQVPFTPEEEAEFDLLEEQDLSKEQTIKARLLREERNKLLAETDWMALSDITMSDSWRTYRQDLRDITEQPTFPDEVIWPQAPQ